MSSIVSKVGVVCSPQSMLIDRFLATLQLIVMEISKVCLLDRRESSRRCLTFQSTDVLEKLSKTAGGGFMAALGGSKKFGGLDIKVRSTRINRSKEKLIEIFALRQLRLIEGLLRKLVGL